MAFSSRLVLLSCLSLLITSIAWIIPGIYPKMHRGMLISAWIGLPMNNKATGGKMMAKR